AAAELGEDLVEVAVDDGELRRRGGGRGRGEGRLAAARARRAARRVGLAHARLSYSLRRRLRLRRPPEVLHHTEQALPGFIGVPAGHLNAGPNPGWSTMTPLVRHLGGECGLDRAISSRRSGVSLEHHDCPYARKYS